MAISLLLKTHVNETRSREGSQKVKVCPGAQPPGEGRVTDFHRALCAVFLRGDSPKSQGCFAAAAAALAFGALWRQRVRGPANGAAPPPPEGHTGRTLLMGRPRCLIGGRDEQAGGVGGWVGACRARRRCPPARPLGPAGGDTPARARTLAPGFFKADIISYHRLAGPLFRVHPPSSRAGSRRRSAWPWPGHAGRPRACAGRSPAVRPERGGTGTRNERKLRHQPPTPSALVW